MTVESRTPGGSTKQSANSTATTRLFLRTFKIHNYRAIGDLDLEFQPGLNVIIGANNSAKTAVMDGLRVLLSSGTYENREDYIRVEPQDVHIAAGKEHPQDQVTVSFEGEFIADMKSNAPVQLYELLDPEEDTVESSKITKRYASLRLKYSVDYVFDKKLNRYKYLHHSLTGGHHCQNPVPLEALDCIRSIYLAPLRDLNNDSYRIGQELETLFLSHVTDKDIDEKNEIPRKLLVEAQQLIKQATNNEHEQVVNQNFREYAAPYEPSERAISFTPAGISNDLFRSLRPIFHSSINRPIEVPIEKNGLGINQLIYSSIVLSRDNSAGHDQYVFYIIEEPEAHLHPQLQDTFFASLNKFRDKQLFVTSHSPTLTAKTDLQRITILHPLDAQEDKIHSTILAEQFAGHDDDARYVSKFLDVTKSQMLFATGAIFVEGVTEAMLLQCFSEMLGCSLRDHGIEIVTVGSAWGFDHYKPLFNHHFRAAFITDGDESSADVREKLACNRIYEVKHDSDKLYGIYKGLGTFEFQLIIANQERENGKDTLRTALSNAAEHHFSSPKHDNDENTTEESKSSNTEIAKDAFMQDFLDFKHPADSYERMKQQKADNQSTLSWNGRSKTNGTWRKVKSDYSFYLLEELVKNNSETSGVDPSKRIQVPVEETEEDSFKVPEYIAEAIKFVVGD